MKMMTSAIQARLDLVQLICWIGAICIKIDECFINNDEFSIQNDELARHAQPSGLTLRDITLRLGCDCLR